MDNLSDLQLIEIFKEGNNNALNAIVNRYSQTIYRFSYSLTNNIEEANDIAQETFIKAWKNISRFDKDKNFTTWLFTIARRTAIDHFRKKRAVNFSSLDGDESNDVFEDSIIDENKLAHEIFEENENIELIRNALSKLSIENRIIVLLHDGEEMTFEEIAKMLEKPMNTIKSIYRRSILKLKDIISKYHN